MDSVCFDFDGTLCEFAYPDIGEPREEMISYAIELSRGYRIIIFTCRPWFEYDVVKEWLDTHLGMFYSQLIMGKPLAVAYIDDCAIEYPKDLISVRRRFESLIDQREEHRRCADEKFKKQKNL